MLQENVSTIYLNNLAMFSARYRTCISWWQIIQGGPKKFGTIFKYALTLPNSNQFSNLFHCQNQEKICDNTIIKDPTAPQRVSLLYLMKWQVF